jgi:hypothetical protein
MEGINLNLEGWRVSTKSNLESARIGSLDGRSHGKVDWNVYLDPKEFESAGEPIHRLHRPEDLWSFAVISANPDKGVDYTSTIYARRNKQTSAVAALSGWTDKHYGAGSRENRVDIVRLKVEHTLSTKKKQEYADIVKQGGDDAGTRMESFVASTWREAVEELNNDPDFPGISCELFTDVKVKEEMVQWMALSAE